MSPVKIEERRNGEKKKRAEKTHGNLVISYSSRTSRLACWYLGGERAELVFDCHNLVGTFIGGLDGLAMLIRDIMLDVKNFRLLTLAGIGASNVPGEQKSSQY